MTDTAAARAYPPDPEEDSAAPNPAIPPAAHTHALGAGMRPAVSPSSTAVLDSVPPLGFLGEMGGGVPRAFGGEPGPSEPPPFGFNAPEARPADTERGFAPAGDEAGAAVPAERPAANAAPHPGSVPATAAGEAATAAPPAASVPATPMSPLPSPMWPRQEALPPVAPPPALSRRDLAPRDLMPSSGVPLERHRLGEAPTPTFGPPGRERSTAAMVLLSVVTLGFYAVAWHRRVNQEMGDFDPRIHVEPARSAWAVALPLLAGLLVTAAAAARILLAHAGVQLDVPVSVGQAWIALAAVGAVPYLVMLLPFSMVAVAMTAERVRVVEDHAGLATDEQLRPAALVGWLAVPVLGGFVVMARQQSHLNRIWHLARS